MSDFRLYPVPQNKLSCLENLLESARQEMKMEDRSDVKYTLTKIEAGYSNRAMAAYVDNIENPSHCLIVATLPGIVTKGDLAVCILIYSLPTCRTPKSADILINTFENYSKLTGATGMLASEWLTDCANPIGVLWKSKGFVAQETVFFKAV